MCGAATLLALLALMLAPFAPALTNAEAFTVPANERLVEVAIGLEVLRAVGTRRWVWLAVPIASGALQLTAYSAGIFSLVIILFALCALPLVMGTLGPTASSRPLGTIRDQRWRFLGVVVIVASALAFASETALWFTSLFDPSLVARNAVAQLFYPLAILSFGPLALAWVLMQIVNLLAGRWKSSIIWLFAAAAYVPVVVLMVQANIFPVFLGTFDVVLLGMGWWIVHQPLNRDSTTLRVEPLAQATSV